MALKIKGKRSYLRKNMVKKGARSVVIYIPTSSTQKRSAIWILAAGTPASEHLTIHVQNLYIECRKLLSNQKKYNMCRPERVGGEGLEVNHQGLSRVGVRVGRLRPVLTSLPEIIQYLQI